MTLWFGVLMFLGGALAAGIAFVGILVGLDWMEDER